MTLLPALLILLEKLMAKTSKRDLSISGKGLCDFAVKRGKPVLAFVLVLIILGGVLLITSQRA